MAEGTEVQDKLDITHAYFNTVEGLFRSGNLPGAVELKTIEIASYVHALWVNGVQPEDNLFWCVDNEAHVLDFRDLLAFLITERSPASYSVEVGRGEIMPDTRPWHVNFAEGPRLSETERLQLLESVVDGCAEWTAQKGQLNPGINEICDFAAAILKTCAERPDDPNSKSYLGQINRLFSRLVENITSFTPAQDIWEDMRDANFAFERMSELLTLKMPEDFLNRLDLPYNQGMRDIAQWASKIMLAQFRHEEESEICTRVYPIAYGPLAPKVLAPS